MVHGGEEVQLHAFLTSALAGGEWSATLSNRFTPVGKSPRYPFDRRLGRAQSRSGSGDDKKKNLCPFW
jgi:hypothetical protein